MTEGRNFARLLPTPPQKARVSSSVVIKASSPPARRPKRSLVQVACLACRKGKTKCDGNRPRCARCVHRNSPCGYDVEPETTRVASLKRKHETAQGENEQLHQLFDFIRSRPETEAYEIFRRIRTTSDPIAVLNLIKDGDLLLQQLTSGFSSASLEPRLQKIEQDALQAASIKVHARPWTAVAGNGLVSELISGFFDWDLPFHLSCVDRDAFLSDMREGKPATAKYCCPALVNAMCALRSFTSDRAKLYGRIQGCDMLATFLAEAKKLLDLEYGKLSIPSIQSLLIMYITSAGMGKDRAGVMFRYAAYEMLKRLRLENAYRFLDKLADDEETRRDKRAISRMLWGVYCFEAMSAFLYIQPSLVHIPNIPRYFFEQGASSRIGQAGNPKTLREVSSLPEVTDWVLYALCELSQILNEILAYGCGHQVRIGSPADLQQRTLLFTKVIHFKKNLHPALDTGVHFETTLLLVYYLSSIADITILGLLRPLNPDIELPGGVGTAGDICLKHCCNNIDSLEACSRLWPLTDHSIMPLFPLYNVSITLCSRLRDPRTHEPFIRTCSHLLECSRKFPFAQFLLQGIRIMTEQSRMPVPLEVQQMFDAVKLRKEELTDVPISFVLPPHEEMVQQLNDDKSANLGGDSTMGKELGTLIARWSALSG